jgi:MFS family permease
MIIPALGIREYKKFISAHTLMMIGDWLISCAEGWLAYDLTGSPFLLTLLMGIHALPNLLFAPFAGPLADSVHKQKIVFFAQLFLAITAGTFALITLTGNLTYQLLIVYAIINGTLWSLLNPSIFSFTLDMVGADHIMNANSLTQTAFNFARILGPLIGGFLYQISWGWCFVAAGIFSIPELIILPTLKVQATSRAHTGSLVAQFKAGAVHVWQKRTPLLVMMAVSFTAILGYSGNILIAPICDKVFQIDMKGIGYGILSSTVGIGSLIGATTLSVRKNFKNGLKMFATAIVIFPVIGLLIGLSVLIKNIWLLGFLYICFGTAIVYVNAMAMNIMPTITDPEYIGRSIGLFTTSFAGMLPFGNILTGFASTILAIPSVILGAHGLLLVPSVLLAIAISKGAKQKQLPG